MKKGHEVSFILNIIILEINFKSALRGYIFVTHGIMRDESHSGCTLDVDSGLSYEEVYRPSSQRLTSQKHLGQ